MTVHHDSVRSNTADRYHTLNRGVVLAALAALAATVSACGGCESQGRKPDATHVAGSPPSASIASTGNASVAGAQVDGSALERYALAEPDLHATLPLRLQEASGLTDISDTQVACVQDEDGVVFVYDLGQKKVTRQVRFGPSGDYEGLTRVGKRLYVLRSDGVMYELDNWLDSPTVRTRELNMHTRNNEGLCFDPGPNRLLIAPKSRMGKGKAFKNVRPIYAFDLKQEALQPDPALLLSVAAIREFAEAHGLAVPEKEKKKGGGKRVMLRFMPSSLAVHPTTSELFVISAMDRVLASFDTQGNVTGYVLLDAGLFPQPEGITFLANGDLVVTNEGAGKEATLLRFKWKRKQG